MVWFRKQQTAIERKSKIEKEQQIATKRTSKTEKEQQRERVRQIKP